MLKTLGRIRDFYYGVNEGGLPPPLQLDSPANKSDELKNTTDKGQDENEKSTCADGLTTKDDDQPEDFV